MPVIGGLDDDFMTLARQRDSRVDECRSAARLSHNCRARAIAMTRVRWTEHGMLVVEGLTCRFGTKAAVDNASFSVAPGGFIGVIGRSGAGKSTLLRTINRLAPATSGRILFNDQDVTALQGKELRKWRARSAMIFQQFNLIGRLDVLTNVLMGRLSDIPAWRSLFQIWPEEDVAVAMSALEQFDMAQHAAQRADQLSGGQQQRVAIARALVQEPEIILA